MEASTLTQQEAPGLGVREEEVKPEQEVKSEEEVKEENKSDDEKTVEEVQEELEESINILEFQEPKKWTLGQGKAQRVYVQKPLSYLRKMQFFALVGATARQVMATGESGALSELLGGAGIQDALGGLGSGGDDLESFVSLASSLAIYVPDFLEQAYCVILNIPPIERDWAKEEFEKTEDEGGLSDEDHKTIIQTFIAQNWEAISNFFSEDLPTIFKTVQARNKKTKESQDTE